MWVVLGVLLLSAIVYGIYAWAKSAEEERKLEAARLAAKGPTGTEEEKSNFWKIIAGIAGVLGEEGVGTQNT